MNKKFLYEYLKKRKSALPLAEAEKLRDRLLTFKTFAIDNMEVYLGQAKKSLEKNGCQVYLASTNIDALNIINKLIAGEKYIVKSKSNTINKVGISEIRAEVIETDTGDFLSSLAGKKDPHPVIPALSLTEAEMAAAIKKKLNVDVEPKPEKIVAFVRSYLREKIKNAKTGLTGANAVTAEGQVVILENEGNISLLSHLPDRHIVVVGVNKIVKNMSEANDVVKAAAVWGTGQDWPNYVNVISGPSKTGDIQNELVFGAHGAREVHVIFVDAGRFETARSPFKEKLYCINCGACYDCCPIYNTSGLKPKISDFEKNYSCSLCSSCTINCPVKIDWQKLTKMARNDFVKDGKISAANKKMIENVRQYGNPFGKQEEGKTLKELYCC
ncbi:lactate utilization protein [Candidatus Parcubacteria bacterium]|nr:MAG: lactate utilization protein [Candidatus Parcubacteria bacterium]